MEQIPLFAACAFWALVAVLAGTRIAIGLLRWSGRRAQADRLRDAFHRCTAYLAP